MPTSYVCDNCGATADSLDGWLLVSVTYLHVVPNMAPPGGRSLDQTAPDLLFHVAACREAWCGKAGVAPPAVPEAPVA